MLAAAGAGVWHDAMEPVAGTDKGAGDAVPRRDAHAQLIPDRADHGGARQVRPDRGQERLLLVPEPQGPRAAEAEARRPAHPQHHHYIISTCS